ncbi:MAG: aldo/keto reductase [Bacteroidaceae bacterium]|jgi:L-glyceraldehyde 3-phosphate reductase|nr:aldo/keto reductase [Bacteroidaceae bacterium]MBR3619467.1 aldo/keto reductase [Bacteroidaceae bacterium]
MIYQYCGKSGVQLPVLSLGLWHNFGSVDDFSVATQMVLKAFDAGICHFDLANNYGPEPGSAETNFGRILKENLASHRDELFISSKAGHDMWPGVYGGNSSRKNLIASCDQSLKRTGLDYFDIFYSHRYDGVTPIEETMQALIDLVRQGKALYVGISKYPPELQQRCYDILKEAHVPCLLSQYRCSMFDPKAKNNNFQIASDNGSGIICFSPLAQGLLTGKYDNGIPAGSRASKSTGFLQESQVTPERVEAVKKLALIAKERRQSMAQMALAWVLADERVTSCIIGTSSVAQLENNLETLQNLTFSAEEMEHINNIISNPSLWF